MADIIDFDLLGERQEAFAQDRDWTKGHVPKNVAMALAVECSEILEIFQWAEADEEISGDTVAHLASELADVLIYLTILARNAEISLSTAVDEKLVENEERF